MNIIHILGITIFISTSYSAIEEKKTQKTLLRKLLTYQPKESQPMWNEVLADVFVNKIRIFSFKNDVQPESIKEEPPQEKSALTNFFSQLFFVYKKFVYDIFVTPSINNNGIDAQLTPEIEERNTDDVMTGTNVTYNTGPKSEVELVEPRYHGKQELDNGTEVSENAESEEVGESVLGCPEGTVRVNEKCESSSRLLMAIPRQCPIGYKRDRLGYCRLIF